MYVRTKCCFFVSATQKNSILVKHLLYLPIKIHAWYFIGRIRGSTQTILYSRSRLGACVDATHRVLKTHLTEKNNETLNGYELPLFGNNDRANNVTELGKFAQTFASFFSCA